METIIIDKSERSNEKKVLSYSAYLAYDKIVEEKCILFTSDAEIKAFYRECCITTDINRFNLKYSIIKKISWDDLKVTFEF